ELGRLMTLPEDLAGLALRRPSSPPLQTAAPALQEGPQNELATAQRQAAGVRAPIPYAKAGESPPAKVPAAKRAKAKSPKRPRAKKAAGEAEGEVAAEATASYAPIGPLTGPLATDIRELITVRGRLASALRDRKFTRVGELLFHLPRAYEDRRKP